VHLWALAGTAFLASAVEAIEAVTIVLAVGYAQSWRIALAGAAYAGLALVAIAVIGGPAILHFVPIRIIRIAVGVFLLWFGYGWLRKAVLRYAGRIPLRDELASFERQLATLRNTRERRAGLAAAFNGVFLEGLEVAIIVVTVGSASSSAFAAAVAGALAALVLVAIAAVLVRRPLGRIPENAIKFVVGVMLVSFGTFWLGEGLGMTWHYGDGMLPILAACYAGLALLISLFLRSGIRPRPGA
jgi:Ca2+/H+ antiporter, TMEM165/GDT1 family